MDSFFVYIIYSLTLDKFYVGYSGDLEKRFLEHNAGISTYTSKAIDWELKWSKAFINREQAMVFCGIMATTSSVAAGLAATDPKLVPYGS